MQTSAARTVVDDRDQGPDGQPGPDVYSSTQAAGQLQADGQLQAAVPSTLIQKLAQSLVPQSNRILFKWLQHGSAW